MKNIRLIVITCVALVVLVCSANAQQKTPQEMAHQRATVLKTELVLTDAQTTQVEQILTTFVQSNQAARKNKQKGAVKINADKRDVELKKVLTSDQWNKLVAFRAKGGQGKKK